VKTKAAEKYSETSEVEGWRRTVVKGERKESDVLRRKIK
jgi:hypothetical protein